jgi:hypothetical protein
VRIVGGRDIVAKRHKVGPPCPDPVDWPPLFALRLPEPMDELSDSKLNATESPKLFANEKKSRDIIVLLLE